MQNNQSDYESVEHAITNEDFQTNGDYGGNQSSFLDSEVREELDPILECATYSDTKSHKFKPRTKQVEFKEESPYKRRTGASLNSYQDKFQ